MACATTVTIEKKRNHDLCVNLYGAKLYTRSTLAQRKRVGLITQRSLDRNQQVLHLHFFFFLMTRERTRKIETTSNQLFLHVGQCGNQIGDSFWTFIDEAKQQHTSFLFHNQLNQKACFFIDTEPKVIQNYLNTINVCNIQKKEMITYPSKYYIEQSGCGNNWAIGFTQTREMVRKVMEDFRKEIEVLDRFDSTLMFHSIGGGTGSGLGSKLLQEIRDHYPKPYLLTQSVAPSAKGDSPLQNYNSILAIESLQEYADCIVWKENDELTRTIAYWKAKQHKTRKLGGGSIQSLLQNITLKDMNHAAAMDLIGLVLPYDSTSGGHNLPFNLGGFVQRLCPIPNAKFVDVRSAFYCKKRATHVLKHAIIPSIDHSMVKLCNDTLSSFTKTPWKSLSTQVIARGDEAIDTCTIEKMCKKAIVHVPWNPSSVHVDPLALGSSFHTAGATSVVTVASNRTSITSNISQFAHRASLQLNAKAYLHWYAKYGIESSRIEDALENCFSIIDAYDHLSAG